ncbi:unnamed protein product [Clonostachys solani]|uniref:Uncharacterized protein n=1 Tax=Clonostachys solani TaxID=160281 RepID=A0A9P0EKK9_9HYPO|nr:unnamed protein product [Clonostachys solani]
MPPEGERPFLVAGYIAIWKPWPTWATTSVTLGLFFGRVGFAPAESPGHLGEQLYQELDSGILSYVEDGKLLYLAEKVFIDCEAIPVLGQILVIELPEVRDEDLAKASKLFGAPLQIFHLNWSFSMAVIDEVRAASHELRL